ncbi:MAG: TolC family protein [Synergistaceae bacterium]|nr:TolC family protein [Synergistaceae bacterium]
MKKNITLIRSALAASLLASVICGPALAGELSGDVNPNGVITIDRCIELALEAHPRLREARSGVESQGFRVDGTAAQTRPQVRVSSSYARSYNEGGGEAGSINTDITLSQTIFDWNRTNLSIQAARQELEARQSDESASEQDVIRDVIKAYFSLNCGDRTLAIAKERLRNYERRLEWATDFYKAGAKAKIEVTKAKTDLANAKLDLVTAEGTLRKAESNLAYAAGVPDMPAGNVKDMLDAGFLNLDVSVDEAIETAMRNRDEYRAQNIRIDAAETNLALAKKGMSPTVTGNAGYTYSGENNPIDRKGWRLSVGISIPVTDGGETRTRVRQAEADLEGARASGESVRQNIISQVRTACTSLEEARESVAAAREAEKQALETLRLAEGRYTAGVGESLEISDAVDGYARARMSAANALYNKNAAEVDLLRAIGGMLR